MKTYARSLQTYVHDEETRDGDSLNRRWEAMIARRADELALAYARGDWDAVDSVVADRETLRSRLERESLAVCP